MGGKGTFVMNFTLFIPTNKGADAPASFVAFDKIAEEIHENGEKGGFVELEAEFIQIKKNENGKTSYESKFLVQKVFGIHPKTNQ